MSKVVDAMGLVSELNKTHGVAQRGGKKYTQVVHRMEAFRTVFGFDCGVNTEILVDDGHRVVVKAVITNSDGIVIGSGMAEEIRGQGNVNKTSALENCETSAVGRALASIGLSGGEYASANELDGVQRKSDAMASDGGSVRNPPPSVEAPSEPPQDDPHKEADVALYQQLRVKLENIKLVGGVHNLFAETKSTILEIKQRNPARAKMLFDLFQKHEQRLGGK